uniref:SKI/SNO/DAC domain-containing protein n=1 Tax=Ditylenchus dipsaci TaxID=166011 RepID=A0A915DU85_9BILA
MLYPFLHHYLCIFSITIYFTTNQPNSSIISDLALLVQMMEPLAAIQRLAEARALGMDQNSTTTASSILQSSLNFSDRLNIGQRMDVFPDESQMSREDEEDYEDDDSLSALCSAPNNLASDRQMAQREPANAVLFNYRGERVAGFEMDAGTRHMICLPQVYELFLKQLVGGLHTVYTKLKRLHIYPLICNVEQVRALRSLGAIQPGVNRCKLIEKVDFDKLYDDCTNTKSRPGRPPKRSDGSCSMDDCWNNSSSSAKRERLEDSSCGGLMPSSSSNDLSLSSTNLRGSSTPNVLQLPQSNSQQQILGSLLPLTAQHLLMQHMMAAAAAVVSQQQIQQQQQDVQQQQRLRSISSTSLNNPGNNTQGGDETSSSSNESSSAATAANNNTKQGGGIGPNDNSKAQEWTNNNGHTVLIDGLTANDKEVKCQRAESNRFSNQ